MSRAVTVHVRADRRGICPKLMPFPNRSPDPTAVNVSEKVLEVQQPVTRRMLDAKAVKNSKVWGLNMVIYLVASILVIVFS